ncbi:polyhydroxyalkanoate synthesis repressor PhaR [Paracoccus zhejiangensis]|uniref:Polyhydroxyalkanoate synthesis repressor PhaR n=1 Tax=Paracoccus zhejiangensis TaxID=1077935 RepID=A0A2H5EXM7_9RHOB|nr:polyhydroxyalkanoate synthesis repressor PhaR [Paracoccus zhejiangensis]AUH64052.1 polyhydroxyalkanoate synthesis repressor PhaR [Paracoccus zhejiangensis]
MAATETPLLIKRYASRRLYNTETSDYVTLEDIAVFVREGREVKIVDLKTGDDLTRQYLLQIVADHESRGENVLPIDVLTDLVRSYTTQAQSVVPQFLAASFEMLREGQSKMMENMATMPNPMAKMPGFDALQRQQQMFLKAMMGGWRGGASGPDPDEAEEAEAAPMPAARKGKSAPAPQSPPAADGAGDGDDMVEIRRQLAELQNRISKL